MSLELKNISLSFHEQGQTKTIFSDYDLILPDRGLAVLCGASGRGKTTLLRLIAGLCKPDRGVVTGRTSVSFCFQEHRLFPQITALDNVTRLAWKKASEAQRCEAAVMLEKLGLSQTEQQLKHAKLSGGMAQRVSLARAFCAPAELLLLDEPLKELDVGLRRTVMELIREQSLQRLTVVAAHEPDEWLSFDPIIITL